MFASQEEFDATVNEVAAGSEYKVLQLKKKLFDFLAEVEKDIFNWLVNQSSNSDWDLPLGILDGAANILVFLGVVLIGVVVVYAVLFLLQQIKSTPQVKEILGEKITADTTPQSLKEQAAYYEAEGHLRKAIRYQFIALLYLMHQQSILYLDQSKTNQEISTYLKENNFSRLKVFQNLVAIFNAIWYGHQSCEEQSYSKWSDNFNLLWKEVQNNEV